MKISRLPDRLDRMPMLKILVFFAAGIALADRYELPGFSPPTASHCPCGFSQGLSS